MKNYNLTREQKVKAIELSEIFYTHFFQKLPTTSFSQTKHDVKEIVAGVLNLDECDFTLFLEEIIVMTIVTGYILSEKDLDTRFED